MTAPGSAGAAGAAGGGLTGMRERVSAFGGELDLRPPPAARLAGHGPAPPRRGGCGMISVLLVDDHPLIRKGFRLVLSAEPDIEVVGEAADGRTARHHVLRAASGRGAHGRPDARP